LTFLQHEQELEHDAANRRSMGRFIVAIAAAASMVAFVVACGGSGSSHKGYLDHTTLEKDLRAQVQTRLEQRPRAYGYEPGTTIKSVLCVQGSGPNDHVFQCALSLSGGQSETIEADVSPNGDSYVTK
jgi:hypothetical protein